MRKFPAGKLLNDCDLERRATRDHKLFSQLRGFFINLALVRSNSIGEFIHGYRNEHMALKLKGMSLLQCPNSIAEKRGLQLSLF